MMRTHLLAGAGCGPWISAHRGFSAKAPENTIAALEAALAGGAHWAEIDVRLTSDGKLVLMHDATLDRTTDGDGPVSGQTLDAVKRLDAGAWFDQKFKGARVPTLDEALDWSRGRLGLIVELKNYPERDRAFVDELVAAILREDAADFTIPAGFDHPTLAEIHRRQPDWSLEMIVPCRLADPEGAARAAGARLVSLEPEFTVAEDVAAMHAAGVLVLTTVTSVTRGRALVEIGVDVLESGDVDLARTALGGLGRSV
jgi:glycerophosphoryl diester phosphodiesterase